MGFDADEDFLNQVVEIATELDPMKLLNRLLEIEKQVGRKRKKNSRIPIQNIGC